MNKTIKIIDLLNDLFDYRETMSYKLPKKIKFNNIEFEFKDMSYYSEDGNNIMSYIDHTLDLRVVAEILDEEEFENIEENNDILRFDDLQCPYGCNEEKFMKYIIIYQKKINQLIKNQKKIIEKLNKNNNTQ